MKRFFSIVAMAVVLAMALSIGVAYADDVKLENVKVDSIVTKIDKNGAEYTRIIFTEMRSIDGVDYPAGTPLMAFGQQAYQLISNWDQIAPGLPENFFERISIFVTNVFMDPLVSVFYFLVLRGVSQLLNLGLDLFYADAEEMDVEEKAAPEQGE